MNNIVQYILVGIIVAFAIYKVVKHLTTPRRRNSCPSCDSCNSCPHCKNCPPKKRKDCPPHKPQSPNL